MPDIRVLATDLEFPEGPVVMPDGSVLLVEIRGQRLTRVWPDGRKEVVAEIPGGPNGAAIGPDGKCYVCNNGGFSWIPSRGTLMPGAPEPHDYIGGSIQRVDLATGKVETVVDKCGEHPLKGPNDLVFDKHGGLWFSDLGKRQSPRHGCRRVLLHQARHEGDRRRRVRHDARQRHRPVAGREHRLHRGDADRAAVGVRYLPHPARFARATSSIAASAASRSRASAATRCSTCSRSKHPAMSASRP